MLINCTLFISRIPCAGFPFLVSLGSSSPSAGGGLNLMSGVRVVRCQKCGNRPHSGAAAASQVLNWRV